MDESTSFQPSQLTRADADDHLINMWLHGRPDSTKQEYLRDVDRFRKFLGYVPLRSLTLEDLQAYQTHLEAQSLKDATKRRKINSIKSLLSFACNLNYTAFNVAAAVRIPKASPILIGRFLRVGEVMRLFAREPHPRNVIFLKLLYATGCRVSEICRLKWTDFHDRDDGEVQATILGKGQKRRIVLVPISVWLALEATKGDSEYVFPGRKAGQSMTRATGHDIIKAAALRAGLDPKISCHWLRHAHATHSLAKGAPLQLVRDTLGHSSIAVTNVYLESNPEDSSSKYLGM